VITREADYALRAVLELAAGTGGRSAAELARATQVPYPFMRRVLARLTAAGLVRSLRGRSGGVRLTRPATDLSLLEVLSAMDADTVTLNACLREGADCARSSWCAAHAALAVVQQELWHRLAAISIASLVQAEQAIKPRNKKQTTPRRKP
jgi:Rrf2 family protein